MDTCQECNYDTWHSRGWCRMEEAALNLERLGDGRALLVTQPLGEAPCVATFDKIDRAWYQTVHKSKLAALITPSTRAYSMAHAPDAPVDLRTGTKHSATTRRSPAPIPAAA